MPLKKVLSILIILFLFIISTYGCKNDNFDEYVDNLFKEELKNNSMDINFTLLNPEDFELEDVRPTMFDLTEEAYEKEINSSKEILKDLNKFNYNKLTDNQKLTYDILKSNSETTIQGEDFFLYSNVISSQLGIQAQLPILFAEYRFDDKQDIEDYLKLIEETPKLFDQIINFEEQKAKKGLLMPTFVIDNIIEQSSSFINNTDDNFLIEIFEDKCREIDGLSSKEIENYISNNKTAIKNNLIPAYEKLIISLSNLKGSSVNENGLYYLDKGSEYYEYLISTYTGSSMNIEEMIEIIENRLENTLLEALPLYSNDSVIETYFNLSYDFDSPEDTIIFLEDSMNDLYSAIEEQSLDIKYVHSSLEEFLSPAFYLIPPIDEQKKEIIYINKNPKYNLDTQLYSTLAHEGYPGHLYQNIYFRQQDVPMIRHLMNYGGYSEGWAIYSELVATDFTNFQEDVKKCINIDRELGLLVQARIDIGVNYEGWDLEYTKDYLSKIFPGIEARPIYEATIEDPGVILKYTIGYLEVLNLKNKALDINPNLNLKDFHDFFLKIGPAPFDIIEKELNNWLNKKETAKEGSFFFYVISYIYSQNIF
ncbi:MAG: DUF885 domain-containing protein [Eubacteriales bacterium]